MTFDLQTTLIAIGAGIAVVILLWIMLRYRRRQSLRGDAAPAVERTADPYAVSKERPYMKEAPPPPPAPAEAPAPATSAAPSPEPELGIAEPAVPLAGEFASIAFPPHSTDHVDDLTRLKGVGPKLAALLNEQGISQYAQLASLDEEGVAALDARMGNFKGRLVRDRVVEQARLLAGGDTDAFEAEFGKLGGA